MALAQSLGVSEGLVNVMSLHTTAALVLNEFQPALAGDMRTFLEAMAARDGGWKHDDPALSDCDRGNAASHLQALLLSHSIVLQVSGGEVVLGQWQRLLLAELDGPRRRAIRVSVMGVA